MESTKAKPGESTTFADNTPGGQCAYAKVIFCTPFVATVNDSTANLQYLHNHDFLKKRENVVLLKLTSAPYVERAEDGQAPAPAPGAPQGVAALEDVAAPSPKHPVLEWGVAELAQFLRAQDLWAVARIFEGNDVNGADFMEFTEEALVRDLKLTQFLARKVLRVRALLEPEVHED